MQQGRTESDWEPGSTGGRSGASESRGGGNRWSAGRWLVRNSGAGGRQAGNQCGMVRNCGGIHPFDALCLRAPQTKALSCPFVNPAGTCRRNPVVSCTGARSATGLMQLGLGRVCVRAAPRGVHRRAAMGRDAPFTITKTTTTTTTRCRSTCASASPSRGTATSALTSPSRCTATTTSPITVALHA